MNLLKSADMPDHITFPRQVLSKRFLFTAPSGAVIVVTSGNCPFFEIGGDRETLWKLVKKLRAQGRTCTLCPDKGAALHYIREIQQIYKRSHPEMNAANMNAANN
jgi:hypothetical protein